MCQRQRGKLNVNIYDVLFKSRVQIIKIVNIIECIISENFNEKEEFSTGYEEILKSQKRMIYYIQGNICLHFIFAPLPSLSAGEFKYDQIPMSHIFFFLNTTVSG